ncbi:hypothetical protein L1D12_15615 [Vibrio parahaemolyticus]|nr:hypothetical protein [Vibrio parahaemolyticus]
MPCGSLVIACFTP